MMESANCGACQAPQFTLLSEDQLQEIHLAALEVLHRTGIRFHHPGALDILKEAGAFISGGNLVKIPSLLVKAVLGTMFSIIMAKSSGANLVHDVGYMESGLGCSYEMVAMTNNLVKGIEVNQDTLVADELHQVGPGGHFLDTENTLARFRDYWYLTLLDRQSAAIGSTVGA